MPCACCSSDQDLVDLELLLRKIDLSVLRAVDWILTSELSMCMGSLQAAIHMLHFPEQLDCTSDSLVVRQRL